MPNFTTMQTPSIMKIEKREHQEVLAVKVLIVSRNTFEFGSLIPGSLKLFLFKESSVNDFVPSTSWN